MAQGFTDRRMGRFNSRWLIHQATIWKWAGKVADKDRWDSLGLFNARNIPSSGVAFSGTDAAQNFDSEVIIGMPGGEGPGAQPAFERTSRYRVKLDEYKSKREKTEPNGPPELKRSYYYEVVSAEQQQDQDGGDFAAVLHCVNAKSWPA